MTRRRIRPVRGLLVAVVGALVLALVAPGGGHRARAADPALAEPVSAQPAGPQPAIVQPAPGQDPLVVRHGPRTDRVVALTFDDGYGPARVRRIFQILVREKVPATFFVNGTYIKQAPDLWRRIAAAGYPIGNHSQLHRDMTTLTPEEIARDLGATRRAVEAATGRPILPYFRPPYGAHNAASDRAAAAAGFPVVVMWDVTAGDSVRHAAVAGVVSRAVAGRPGSIVLLHAGPSVTERALPAIIARYRERGFRFVTVPELLGGQGTPGGVPVAGPPVGSPSSPGRQAQAATEAPGADLGPAPWRPPAATPAPAVPSEPLVATPAPAAPVAPADGASPRPAAREAAWARRDGLPAAIAGATAVGLLLAILVAAAVGRTQRREDDSPG
jgi:peptidoglycan/xylan/chitin deacetylase (PgdA/CDA1 family)